MWSAEGPLIRFDSCVLGNERAQRSLLLRVPARHGTEQPHPCLSGGQSPSITPKSSTVCRHRHISQALGSTPEKNTSLVTCSHPAAYMSMSLPEVWCAEARTGHISVSLKAREQPAEEPTCIHGNASFTSTPSDWRFPRLHLLVVGNARELGCQVLLQLPENNPVMFTLALESQRFRKRFFSSEGS